MSGTLPIGCTPWQFAKELFDPPPEPFGPMAELVRANVPPGSLVWVTPSYATYPLMFHAPNAVYGWQYAEPFAARAPADMPGQIQRQSVPDYIIAFGPYALEDTRRPGVLPAGAAYQLVQSVPVFFKDFYRPELFWRRFAPVPCDVEHGQGVYLFKRFDAAPRVPAAAPPANDFRL